MRSCALVVAVLVLAGCEQPDPPAKRVAFKANYVDGWPVRDFRLADGTRCVTFRESLQCDWDGSRAGITVDKQLDRAEMKELLENGFVMKEIQ